MDVETLGCHMMAFLGERYPAALQAYKLTDIPDREEGEETVAYGYRLLELAAGKRGMRISGGEFDTERMARVLLDEFRGGENWGSLPWSCRGKLDFLRGEFRRPGDE